MEDKTVFGMKLVHVDDMPDGVFSFRFPNRVHSFRVEGDQIVDLGCKVDKPVRVLRDGTIISDAKSAATPKDDGAL